jgi:hypothetical protein
MSLVAMPLVAAVGACEFVIATPFAFRKAFDDVAQANAITEIEQP